MSAYYPTKLYNRFLLLLLFHGCLTFFSCPAILGINDNDIRCHDNERDALLRFKQGIHHDYCGLLDSWGHGHDCCKWHGIQCNNHSAHVIRLHLTGNEYNGPCLEGTLDVSLLELKHLKYLDISYNSFIGNIPKFIGSFTNLEHLDLSYAWFNRIVPSQIGNLTRLSYLFLKCHSSFNMRVENLRWLSQLRLLKVVDLSGINLSVATNNWVSVINSLPFLQELHLPECQLSLTLSPSLSYINSSTTLNYIDLSYNNLSDTSLFQWLLNLSGLDNHLLHLDLSYNQMFGNSLKLSQHAMKILDNLCNLQYLALEGTNLNYNFADIVQSFSTCSNISLKFLGLSFNQVWGSIPENINGFSFLTNLNLFNTQLNGTIAQSLGQLTMLKTIGLSSNSLIGTLTSAHLSNLTELSSLRLGGNTGLIVNISANWIPPFQLEFLDLNSCKIGPNFPSWILTQTNLQYLFMSDTSIIDVIPYRFWNSSSLSSIRTIRMSHNMIYGTLPNISAIFPPNIEIDLSFNKLEGALPLFLRNTTFALLINNNKFSEGLAPFLCPKSKSSLMFLDLSNNLFSDKLPDCWGYFDRLQTLHLENNRLWGNLPNSIGVLDQLVTLHLSNNKLSGELPMSLLNCPSLFSLALDSNLLTGHIPPNFGDSLNNLGAINLHNNKFSGGLPSALCHLSRLQLLDISSNEISGTIPKCLYKLKGMSNTKMSNLDITILEGDVYVPESVQVLWKREKQIFTGNSSLRLLRGIDLSDNKLEGEIPEGISNLLGIKFLNLSRNNLSGAIISRIGQLTLLESLDLSHNRLSGEIPTSLTQISALSVLDLSYNNLSGKIPDGTQLQSFDASAYNRNPGLCGAPLQKCEGDETTTISPQTVANEHNNTNDLYVGLYISLVFGFIIGFWGVCGTLVLKQSWRHAYFRFYENAKDKIYVMVIIYIARGWRRS